MAELIIGNNFDQSNFYETSINKLAAKNIENIRLFIMDKLLRLLCYLVEIKLTEGNFCFVKSHLLINVEKIVPIKSDQSKNKKRFEERNKRLTTSNFVKL